MAMTQEETELMLEYARLPPAEKDALEEAYWAAEDELRRAPGCPQCGEIDHLKPGVLCGPDYQPCPEAEWETRQEQAPAKPRRGLPAGYGHRRETGSAGCRVDQTDIGRWEVHSPSGNTYVVRESAVGQVVCECPAGTNRRNLGKASEPCKHVAAVVLSRQDPANLVEAIREDLLQEEPDIPHALALVEALGGLARV